MREDIERMILDEVRRRRRGTDPIEFPGGPTPFKPVRPFTDPSIFRQLVPPRSPKGQAIPRTKAGAAARAARAAMVAPGRELGVFARREQIRKAEEEEAKRQAAAQSSRDILQALRAKEADEQTRGTPIRRADPVKALGTAIDASNPPRPPGFGKDKKTVETNASKSVIDQLIQISLGKEGDLEGAPTRAISALLFWSDPIVAAVKNRRYSQANLDSATLDARELVRDLPARIAGDRPGDKLRMSRDNIGAALYDIIQSVAKNSADDPRVDATGTSPESGEGDETETAPRAVAKVDDRTIAIPADADADGPLGEPSSRIVDALAKLGSQPSTYVAAKSVFVEVAELLSEAVQSAFSKLFATDHNKQVWAVHLADNGLSARTEISELAGYVVLKLVAAYDAWLVKSDNEGMATSPAGPKEYLVALDAKMSVPFLAGLMRDAINEGGGMNVQVVESFTPASIRAAIRNLFEASPLTGVEPPVRAQDRERIRKGTEVPELDNPELADEIREWKRLTDAKKEIEAQARELRANLETGTVEKGGPGASLSEVNAAIGELYEKQIEPALLEMDDQVFRVDEVIWKMTKQTRTTAKWQAVAKAMQKDVQAALQSEIDRMASRGRKHQAETVALAVALSQVNAAMEAAVGDAMRLLEKADALLPEERVHTRDYAALKQESIGSWFMSGFRAVVAGARRLWGKITGLKRAVDDLVAEVGGELSQRSSDLGAMTGGF